MSHEDVFLRTQNILVCHYRHLCFCGRVPWLYQYCPGGFMLCVVLCPGTPEGSTSSGPGFKPSQKTGQRFKVSNLIMNTSIHCVPVSISKSEVQIFKV